MPRNNVWGFKIVTELMLFDHTEKGKYGTENLQLREETQSVATTNTDSKKDLRTLDSFMKLKPKPFILHVKATCMLEIKPGNEEKKYQRKNWSKSLISLNN